MVSGAFAQDENPPLATIDNPGIAVEVDPAAIPRVVELEAQTNVWNNKVGTNDTRTLNWQGGYVLIPIGTNPLSPWRVSQFNIHKTNTADHVAFLTKD